MRHASRVLWHVTSLAILAISCLTSIGWSQINFTGPQPGEVYREYTVVLNPNGNSWRVTDPGTSISQYPSVAYDLPNPVNHIAVDDLSGAVRAEAVLSVWGGHVGTSGKKIRFNGNAWITIPELSTQNGIPSGHSGECYMTEPMVTLPVPLSNLVSGTNSFEATAGTQNCYGWYWGMYGIYNVMIRVYYDPGTKPHPTGYISSPTSGGSFGENPTITTSITGGSVNRVDILASYYGYDTDGDGISTGYHYDYQLPTTNDYSMDIHNHVGTTTGSPWQVTWNTQWIPDQSAGGVKLLARIRDGSTGIWYCSAEVSNLSLVRSGTSVQMFQTTPGERAWAQGDVGPINLSVTVPTVSGATQAAMFIRSWNMQDVDMEPGDYDYRRFNGNDLGAFGARYYFSYDIRSLPVNQIVAGTNTFSFYSSVTIHHGIEILWPGPALLIRYNGTPSNDPPAITQQPIDQTVTAGQMATFAVNATGTQPLSYQWQKNSSDIGGATNASYTTPATVLTDSGATFRCVVRNNYGTATSTSAMLKVTSGGGGGGGTNVLTNGSFESGTTNWSFYTNGTGSFGTTSPGTSGASAARISITTAGTNVQLYQAGITLEPGTQYTLSFDAYATAARTISVSLGQHASPYANYGLQSRQFSFGTSWQSFSVTFTTSGFSGVVNDGRLMFWFADADVAGDQYTIDNVVLSKAGGSTPVGPTITDQPANQTATEGQTATFSIGATGTAPLSYQWQKNNGDINGATNQSYTTPAVGLSDNGATFRCVVKNNYGTATSNSATLTVTAGGGGGGGGTNVLTNASFESGTTGWSFYTNGSGTFATASPGTDGASAGRISIGAAGSNVQLYQYGFTLEPSTQYTLQFDAYASANRTVTVSLGQHVSPYANYGLNSRPFALGTSWQTFSVTFTTTGFSGTVTDPRLMIWLADADAAGDLFYFDNFILSKPGSGTPVGPTITQQPSNQMAAVGQTATFAVGATGTAPLSYQWQKNNANIDGATNSSYTTPAVSLADDGTTFRCIVRNGYGTATSNGATLSVGTLVNVLANGSFESGTTGWNFYTNGSGGFTTVSPGTNGASAGRVSITTAGSNVQMYQYGYSLDGGTSYTLTFDAYASANRTVSVSVGKHVSPYTNYGLNERAVSLGTSWQSYSISFTNSGFVGTVSDPRLMIWFANANVAGDSYYFDNFVLSKTPSGSPELATSASTNNQIPTTTGIADIYPNPFNPSTNIRYTLLQPAVVTLRVYSVLGQEVATLVDGPQGAGVHAIVWDGRNSSGKPMGSGVYLCRMTGASERGEPIMSVKRMMLLK